MIEKWRFAHFTEPEGGMTVAELIEELKQLPQEARVVIDGGLGSADELGCITEGAYFQESDLGKWGFFYMAGNPIPPRRTSEPIVAVRLSK